MRWKLKQLSDEELEALKEGFLATYPVFTDVLETNPDLFDKLVHKLRCLFNQYRNLKCCDRVLTLYMLIAHYLVMGGYAADIGILPTAGVINSATVGNASIGFEPSPYSSNAYSSWLARTPYGQEYLAWLNSQRGLGYVN